MNALEKKLSKIAAWFQPAYNKIDTWDLPWLREICKDVWDILDKEVKEKIYNLAVTLAKKYGEDKAKEIMEKIKNILSKVID